MRAQVVLVPGKVIALNWDPGSPFHYELDILSQDFYLHCGPLGREAFEASINGKVNEAQLFFKRAIEACKDTNS